MSEEQTRPFWPFQRQRPSFSFLENIDDDWDLHDFTNSSGLSISEDSDHVFVEAAIPGIISTEVDMTYDKGILWIKAEKQEEEQKKRKYYRKALATFSYRVAVPGEIDEAKDPEAICKNGVLKVTFRKKHKGLSKKIPIKEG